MKTLFCPNIPPCAEPLLFNYGLYQSNIGEALIGSWQVDEQFTCDGKTSYTTEILTFHRNGRVDWEESESGFDDKNTDSEQYRVQGYRIYFSSELQHHCEEAFICIIGDKMLLHFEYLDQAVIYTRVAQTAVERVE